jgi:hypothetical protein
LRRDLERPRPLSPQVLESLLSRYEVTQADAVRWLEGHVGELESFEHDLLFSPLFTPDFACRLEYEEVLGEGHLEAGDVDQAIGDLQSSNLRMTLLFEEDRVEAELPAVCVERFVRLLHLDSPLPLDALAQYRPLPAEIRCHLRDRTWSRERHRELLPVLFTAASRAGGELGGYVRFLTEFVRAHRPTSREECARYLGNLAEACEADLEKHRSGSRSFFNPELKAAYAGKWSLGEDVVDTHERMIAMARSIQAMLS